MRKYGFSFSWKRALGISAAKGKVSRATGIPLTKSGRQRKAGRLLGDLAGTALIAGKQLGFKSAALPATKVEPDTTSINYRALIRAIEPGDTVETVLSMVPGLSWVPGRPENLQELTDGCGLRVLVFRGRVSGVQIRLLWDSPWEDLANDVAAHLSISGTAIWSEDSPESGSWQEGDRTVSVSLENGIATVSVGLKSVTEQIIEAMGGLEKVKSLVAQQQN